MAHYEMYFCLPSSAYDSAVGTKIKELYPIVESVDEDNNITYKSLTSIIFRIKALSKSSFKMNQSIDRMVNYELS